MSNNGDPEGTPVPAGPRGRRAGNATAFQLAIGFAGFVFALLSGLVAWIFNLVEPWSVYTCFAAFGLFLGILGWSAVVGGATYFLLMMILNGTGGAFDPPLGLVVGAVVGLLLRRSIMRHRKHSRLTTRHM